MVVCLINARVLFGLIFAGPIDLRSDLSKLQGIDLRQGEPCSTDIVFLYKSFMPNLFLALICLCLSC